MYQPLNTDCNKAKDSFLDTQQVKCTGETREKFIDELISDYLSPQQQKNKDSICSSLKYKKHELFPSKNKNGSKIKKNTPKDAKISFRHKLNIKEMNKSDDKMYDSFLKMNSLWNDYVLKCLLVDKLESLSESLVLDYLKQIDLHGALIECIKSPSKSLIGKRGIIVHEKKNTFTIITPQNVFNVIPKMNNLFQIEVCHVKFVLIGSNMCLRPELRSTKTQRPKETRNIL